MKRTYPDKDTKLFAFLGVLLTVIGFIIVFATRKEDKYAMYYARQGLILFFFWLIAWAVSSILSFIPIMGTVVEVVLFVFVAVLWIIGMIYALSGKQQQIPLVGTYAKMIKV